MGHHQTALDALNKARELDPHRAQVDAMLSRVLTLAGKPDEGLSAIQRAMSLNPQYPVFWKGILGYAYFGLERYEDAERAFNAASAAYPSHAAIHAGLAAALSAAGRIDEARAAIEELLKLSPGFSLRKILTSLPYQFRKDRDRNLDALRKAGLPEG